jgi:hypothetical protein
MKGMIMDKKNLIAVMLVWLCVGNIPLPLGDKQRAMAAAIMGPCMRAIFTGDRTGTVLIGMTINPMFSKSFNEELGVTEEQVELIRKALLETANLENTKIAFQSVMKKIEENSDYETTEEDQAALENALGSIFDGMNEICMNVFSREQMQKGNEMMFVMMGGLEASFLLEKPPLEALDLTGEQKEKLAALHQEFAPEKEKFLSEMEILMKKAVKNGKINLKDFEQFGEQFKETSDKVKKRTAEILTEEQLAKATELTAHPPKFLNPFMNILPDWLPGANSWKPGDDIPGTAKEKRKRKPFPQSEK